MNMPEYITREEVKRVCKELKLKDWSEMANPEVSEEDARIILTQVNISGMDIPLKIFQAGLEVELEHGTRFEDANVTNNHPILTGRIVLAHLKESMDYYLRLEIAELEGDLLKYAASGESAKIMAKYRLLVNAKNALSLTEVKSLK